MSLEQVTGAAGTVTIAGTTITLRELPLIDYGHFMAWMRGKSEAPFKKAIRRIQELEPLKAIHPELYTKKVDQYLMEAEAEDGEEFRPSASAVMEHVMSKEGLSYMIWLSGKYDQPTLTKEAIADLITAENPNNLGPIYEKVFDMLKMFTDPTPGAKQTPKPPETQNLWTGASSSKSAFPIPPGQLPTSSDVRLVS